MDFQKRLKPVAFKEHSFNFCFSSNNSPEWASDQPAFSKGAKAHLATGRSSTLGNTSPISFPGLLLVSPSAQGHTNTALSATPGYWTLASRFIHFCFLFTCPPTSAEWKDVIAPSSSSAVTWKIKNYSPYLDKTEGAHFPQEYQTYWHHFSFCPLLTFLFQVTLSSTAP